MSMNKSLLFFLFFIIGLHANAQFSYSVKTGWSCPEIRHDNEYVNDEFSNLTIGIAVDYFLNKFLGLQSGVNYKKISENKWPHCPPGGSVSDIKSHAAYAEIPVLFTASIIPAPERWRAIWNVGMFLDIPVEQYTPSYTCDYQFFYGFMAALQIEVSSHYFVRSEYQWALSSEIKDVLHSDRRTNMLTVSLGYRF